MDDQIIILQELIELLKKEEFINFLSINEYDFIIEDGIAGIAQIILEYRNK